MFFRLFALNETTEAGKSKVAWADPLAGEFSLNSQDWE